ncbi:MAG: lipopolysaccharide biosynthesis protein [Flavobacteriaceae bacterium]
MMGVVAKQSFYNVLSVILAFSIGAVNTVVFYPRFMGEALYGIVVILLSQSNILQPIFSFGVQHTVIKYFSASRSGKEQDQLLLFSLVIPLLIILPSGLVFFYNYQEIATYLSTKNPELAHFIYLIFLIAVSTAYFEIFYSWARVQKRTIVGNFLKEVYQRVLITILLTALFLQWIDFKGFTIALIIGYYLRLAIIMGYSLWLYCPKVYFEWPKLNRQYFAYSLLIFLSAFGASIIIDIDASMLGKLVEDRYVAYYKVAIFIATIIDAPGRALFQIVSPLVAEAINKNDKSALEDLLKKSGTNLLLVSGLFFVLVNANIDDLYTFIYSLNGQASFALAIPVVLLISLTKLITASTGCLNNIITNSKYYYVVPFFSMGSALTVVLLNVYFIDMLGFVGAAYATLIVITLFNLIKLLFVAQTFKITPYGKETGYLLMLIGTTYFSFLYISFPFAPFFNMMLKCALIVLIYLWACLRLKISESVNAFLINNYQKIKVYLGVDRP